MQNVSENNRFDSIRLILYSVDMYLDIHIKKKQHYNKFCG